MMSSVRFGLFTACIALSCSQPRAVRNPRPQLPNTGAIDGQVTDRGGVPLAGVAIIAGTRSGRSLGITNDAGEFNIAHLRPGSYQVTFDPCSLDAVTRTIVVSKGRTTTADAKLGIPPPPTITEIPIPKIGASPTLAVSTAIEGTVVDQPSGTPLAGVAVIVDSPAMSATKSAITNSAGFYRITNLPPGTYQASYYYDRVTVQRANLIVELEKTTVVGVHIDTSLISTRPPRPDPRPAEDYSAAIFAAAAAAAAADSRADASAQSAARRKILAEANDADELWIIARGPTATSRRPTRRRYGSGQLCAYLPSSGDNVPLPLEQTEVNARILSYAASVGVDQTYHNPYQEKIEAIYTFPLPHNAAVSDFVMTIGSRRIRGIIRERDEAEKIYAEARASGYVAALLTQQRPNIFTQKVANIDPSESIDIKLTYYHMLSYRDGAYSFVFPTVVGPRFNPSGLSDGIGAVMRGAEGNSGQPTELSYLESGKNPPRKLSMRVDIDAGMAIESIESEHHAIDVRRISASRSRVNLAKHAAIPNRDYILNYRVAGERVKSAFMVHEATGDDPHKYFSFVLQPPASVARLERAPLEMIFVIDCSGSMSGVPLAKAKRAIASAIGRLTRADTFQIIRFSAASSPLGKKPIPATAANKERALHYLDSMTAADGTSMVNGIKAALSMPHTEHRLRLVSFMTDGYVGNEAEVLATIYKRLGNARIFSFGVGSSVNRFLLERMAKIGRGAVAYVGLDDNRSDAAVDAFYERISHPALTDIEVDFGNMKVSEVYPSRIPDLFVGRPVVITGKLRGPTSDTVSIRGRVKGLRVDYLVDIDSTATRNHPALAKLWARMKITDLTDRALHAGDAAPLDKQIRNVALYHGIISSFTSFITVDTTTTPGEAANRRVRVPVPLPEGVSEDSIGE